MSSPGHTQQREIMTTSPRSKATCCVHLWSYAMQKNLRQQTPHHRLTCTVHLSNKEPCMCCTLYCIYSRGMQGEHDLIWPLRLRTLSTILPAQWLHDCESSAVVGWSLCNARSTKIVGWLVRRGRNKLDQLPRRKGRLIHNTCCSSSYWLSRVIPSTPTVIPSCKRRWSWSSSRTLRYSAAQAKADI